jgi:hypothetical protein
LSRVHLTEFESHYEVRASHTAAAVSATFNEPNLVSCGPFAANAAWLALATIAHNLTHAAGCLASLFHAKARTGTLRRHLITVAARIARDPAA